MFKSLLEKFTKKGPRGLDQLIGDISKKHREEDQEAAYRLIPDTEIFFPIIQTDPEADPEQMRVDSRTKINTMTVDVQGYKMALFYTEARGNPATSSYGSMTGREALELVRGKGRKKKKADGIVIQSQGEGWLALPTELLAEIVKVYGNP